MKPLTEPSLKPKNVIVLAKSTSHPVNGLISSTIRSTSSWEVVSPGSASPVTIALNSSSGNSSLNEKNVESVMPSRPGGRLARSWPPNCEKTVLRRRSRMLPAKLNWRAYLSRRSSTSTSGSPSGMPNIMGWIRAVITRDGSKVFQPASRPLVMASRTTSMSSSKKIL